jgi:iron complex outermembrane receptor protein
MDTYSQGSAPPGSAAEQALANQVLDQWRNGASQTVCGDVDQSTRESRYDLEIQDTLSLSDSLRLVSGMNYRYDRADSETYFNGSLDDTTWRLFGQLEWRATNTGCCRAAPCSKTPTCRQLADAPGGGQLPDHPRHGLRAVYSEAIRSPDMFENNVNWSYTVKNLSRPAYGQSSGSTSSRPAARATSTRNACARASWATTATSATSG